MLKRQDMLRIARKLVATIVLSMAMVVMSPSPARADWDCLIAYNNDGWSCLNNCEWAGYSCILECSGIFDGEERAVCMDNCWVAEANCENWCYAHCEFWSSPDLCVD